MEVGKKLRRLRRTKGLTLEELANRAGLTKGFLSQIERDKMSPSIAALKAILDVLGEDISTFFKDMDVKEKNAFKKDERRAVEFEKPGVKIESPIPNLHYRELDPLIVSIEPGAEIEDEDWDVEEAFGYILRGSVRITINKNVYTLRKGDCFYIFPESSYRIENTGKKEAEILIVAY
ncbi:MAG: cupin domain-containing protein [Deferribacteres bacterium]|nr:cupin domain-containing protein [Deferribacteres bacterium]